MTAAILAAPYGRIYVITNPVNGKQYVGQTTQPLEARWRQHRSRVKGGGCSALAAAMAKYGEVQFSIRELAAAADQPTLDRLESSWIAVLSTRSPAGYNIASGGDGTGMISGQTKARLSESMRDRWTDPDYRERQRAGVIAKWASQEFRALRAALERDHPERQRLRSAAAAKMWRDERYRCLHLERVRAALSAPSVVARKVQHSLAAWADPEHRAKMAAAMSRPETKARIAKANASSDVKRKRVESARKMWDRPGHREKVAAGLRAAHAKRTAATD